MARRPALQFYPGDWLRDSVSGCSLGAQGLWLRMLMVMHDSEECGRLVQNGKPMPDAVTARRCGTDTVTLALHIAELEDAGVFSRDENGVIFSRRMVREESDRKQTKDRVSNFRSKQTTYKNSNVACNADVTPLKRQCNTHSSSSSSSSKQEEKDSTKNLTSTDITRAVMEENHWSGIELHSAIQKQAQFELVETATAEEIRDRMNLAVKNYQTLKAEDPKYKLGWQRFFDTGEWLKHCEVQNRGAPKIDDAWNKMLEDEKKHEAKLRKQ